MNGAHPEAQERDFKEEHVSVQHTDRRIVQLCIGPIP